MSEKFYVGLDITGFENTGKYRPISRVTLSVDDSNVLTAGDDTGIELTASCPHATQAMVDAILAQVKGYQYQSFTADAANLDPSAELGDGVTVGGVYATISRLEDDGEGYPDISAPGEVALEEDYPSAGPMTQEFNRQIAETRSQITKTATEIRLEVANELEGLSASIDIQLDSITSQITGINGQVSTIQQTVGSITTQITGINGDISSLEQTATSLQTQIRNAQGDISTIEQYVDSITLSVTNGSTSSTIQLKAGSTTIASQNITMSGLVTFTGLANGTTTINGACIKTGTIDADRLNLTGAITFSDLSNSVQNDINDAYTMAEDAQSLAGDTADTVDRWTYRGTTYIDGTKLMTGTVTASTLEGGEIYLLDGAGNRAGSFTLEGASSYSGQAVSIDSGAIALEAQYGAVYLSGGGGAFIDINTRISCGDDITPSRAGSASCGTAAYPWSDVYAETGEVSTSDETLKNSIEPLPDKYVTMLDQIMPKRYKINNGTSGRYHVGFIAQDVELAMALAGVDALEFGGWIKDEDQSGNPIYMLRYTEFIAILWAKIKQLEDRLEAMV